MTDREADILVYGASGYTARLIMEEAKRRGLRTLIGARHPQRTLDLAHAVGLSACVFNLGDATLTQRMVRKARVVIHCAGPFAKTARPMFEACLATGTHYLDITGEIDVFEYLLAQTQKARDVGITAIPGIGFDVVPSDCLAAMLKEKLPEANSLSLAIDAGRAGFSPGTAKTVLASASQGGRARVAGKIVSAPLYGKSRTVPFPNGAARCYLVPWGDVATAYHATGIPNIETLMAFPAGQLRLLKLFRWVRLLFALPPCARLLERAIARFVKGPAAPARQRGTTQLWGEALTDDGRKVELAMCAPEAYTLTARAAVAAAEKILAGGIATGVLTPSMALGSKFALELEGVHMVP